jgi:integrase
MNLAAYFRDSYLPRLQAKGVRAATIGDYQALVRSAPSDPTADSVIGWLAAMPDQPATRNRKRRYLLALLRDARRHGLVGTWIEDVPKAIEFERLPRAWTVAEFGRLLAACHRVTESYVGVRGDLWWRSFLLSLWYSGVRVQTLLSTTTDNLDLATATLVVNSTKDRRQILYALPADNVEAIRAMWSQRQLVWPWPYADHKKTLLRRIRMLIAWAELPQLLQPFHSVRRSVASYITSRTGLAAACEYLDHCRPSITARFYVDPRIAGTTKRGASVMPTPSQLSSPPLPPL